MLVNMRYAEPLPHGTPNMPRAPLPPSTAAGNSLLPYPAPTNGDTMCTDSSGISSMAQRVVVMIHHTLRRLVQQSACLCLIPDRNGCVHLHRVVGLDRRDVGLVDLHRSLRKGVLRISSSTWRLACLLVGSLAADQRLLRLIRRALSRLVKAPVERFRQSLAQYIVRSNKRCCLRKEVESLQHEIIPFEALCRRYIGSTLP